MLRTWSGMSKYTDLMFIDKTLCTGLMYFCMDDMRAIRSLVDTLRIPSLETRVGVCSLFHTDHTHIRNTGNYSRHVLRSFELEIT
jgi:Rapamycin-insensitive companion of mTOR, N-term